MIEQVGRDRWITQFAIARATRPIIAAQCSTVEELVVRMDLSWYLYREELGGSLTVTRGGFAVSHTGELVGLHCRVAGHGSRLIEAAVAHGARRLDCYGGWLVPFYMNHGFTEVDRQPNRDGVGPDVVYMMLEMES